MLLPRTDNDEVWPGLPYAEWKETLTTLHMWALLLHEPMTLALGLGTMSILVGPLVTQIASPS